MENGTINKSWVIFAVFFVVVCWMSSAQQSFGAPVPGGPGFVSVGSFGFRPYTPGIAYDYTGGRLYNKEVTTEVFLAPVHLPHGAIVTQVVLYYVDNGSADIRVYLWATPPDNPPAETPIVDMTTSGASPDPRTLIITNFPNGNLSIYGTLLSSKYYSKEKPFDSAMAWPLTTDLLTDEIEIPSFLPNKDMGTPSSLTAQ